MGECKEISSLELENHFSHTIPFHLTIFHLVVQKKKIVMEFCDAGSLATVIMKLEPLNEDQICIVMKDMLTGLEYLHARRMIHRDIKADNVLLTMSGYSKLGAIYFY